MAVVYDLCSSIVYSVAYVGDIFLLFTVFALLTQLNKRIASNSFFTKLPFIWTYSIFCAVLFTLYLAILALWIQYHVEITQHGYYTDYLYVIYHDYDSDLQIMRTATKIMIAYYALYMVSSITTLGLAVTTSMRLSKEQAGKQKPVLLPHPLIAISHD